MNSSETIPERCILLVDDEPSLALAGQRVLEGVGFHVTAFTNASEALGAFEADPSAFDAVVTDLTMPGLSGLALARRLLALRPDLPIVLCTGRPDLLDGLDIGGLGVRAMVEKPCEGSELAATVNRVLYPAGPRPTAGCEQNEAAADRPSASPSA